MATPDLPRDDLVRYLRQLEARIAIVEQRSPLANTGLSVSGVGVTQVDGALNVVGTETVSGNLTVTGTETVSGDLNVTGTETVSGDLNVGGTESVSGSLNVGGNLAVTGTFSLPAGSIHNSWLANLVGFVSAAQGSWTGWPTSTSMADRANTSVTVPAGFTAALILAWGEVVFQDSAPNRFDCRVAIAGEAGPTILNLAANAGATTVLHSRYMGVTGGQVLSLSVQVLSAVATAGMPANQAVIGGLVLFSR